MPQLPSSQLQWGWGNPAGLQVTHVPGAKVGEGRPSKHLASPLSRTLLFPSCRRGGLSSHPYTPTAPRQAILSSDLVGGTGPVEGRGRLLILAESTSLILGTAFVC